MTTLKASIVLVTEKDGKRTEFEVVRSGKKYTFLKNISAGYDCLPRAILTNDLQNYIDKGFYKIIV